MKSWRHLRGKLKWIGCTFILCAAFLFLLSGMMPEDVLESRVHAKVKISATSKKIVKGETYKLKIKGTSKKVTWKTSKSSVAKVSSSGVVTAVDAGACTITAKVSGKKYTCKVTVIYPTYTVKPDSLRFNGKTYSGEHDVMLKTYMEQIEKMGGGTLVFSTGTYRFKNTVYIPSNTTVKCEKGVLLEKVDGSGAAATMFGIVPPSKSKTPVYGYKGSNNIQFMGNGAVVDMRKIGMTFTLGHSQNVTITDLNMINMATEKYHFFEINSSKDITLTNCNMEGTSGKVSSMSWKECINIDSDDNDGFNAKWSSKDSTCCDNITISNCTFKNVKGAIGTHNYSSEGNRQYYHEDIIVSNCMFENVGDKSTKSSHTIRMMSWKGAKVTDCSFKNCTGQDSCPIRLDGSDNPIFTNNRFEKCGTTSLSTTNDGSSYKCSNAPIYATKTYSLTNPECITHNTYTSKKQGTLDIYKKPYEFYQTKVTGNKVDGKDLKFVKK